MTQTTSEMKEHQQCELSISQFPFSWIFSQGHCSWGYVFRVFLSGSNILALLFFFWASMHLKAPSNRNVCTTSALCHFLQVSDNGLLGPYNLLRSKHNFCPPKYKLEGIKKVSSTPQSHFLVNIGLQKTYQHSYGIPKFLLSPNHAKLFVAKLRSFL